MFIRDESGKPKFIHGAFTDVTERKQAEARAAAFAELGHKLSAARTMEEAAEAIVQVADELLGWDACFVGLRTDDPKVLHDVLRMDVVNGQRVKVCEPDVAPSELSRSVLDTGEARLILREKPTDGPKLKPFGDTGRLSASLMFAPVRHQGRSIGLLSVQSYTPRAYTQDDLAMRQALADHCAGALCRVHAEEVRRASEARYRTLFETCLDGVVLADTSGNILTANPAVARELTLERPEEIVGKDLLDFLPPEERPRAAEETRQLLQTGAWPTSGTRWFGETGCGSIWSSTPRRWMMLSATVVSSCW